MQLQSTAQPSDAFQRNAAIVLHAVRTDAQASANAIVVPLQPRHQPAALGVASTQQTACTIIGNSLAVRRVLHEVQQVAASEATVLILGETGTGKELVAHAVHTGSSRHTERLVRVNCAALPAGLIESDLFGHERGAFTGAVARREGRFAMADGGTLFLDEVGELPLDVQAKLLRVLQEGEFEPVGSSQTRRVDVRIVAATNCDLRQAVRDGTFREDLYYRLNVFPIRLPALRDRKEDIACLVDHFAARHASRMQCHFQPIGANTLRTLQAYDWPGNVRELQNLVERAAICGRDGVLEVERFLPVSETVCTSPVSTLHSAPRILRANELRQLEHDNIVRAMTLCEWQVAGSQGAARLLGMNPSTLSSRIKALGIKRPN